MPSPAPSCSFKIELSTWDKKVDIVVPPSGVLDVRSFGPFEEPRHWSATRASGASIPVYEPADSEIALRGGGLRWGMGRPDMTLLFVGTAEEFSRFDLTAWWNEKSRSE